MFHESSMPPEVDVSRVENRREMVVEKKIYQTEAGPIEVAWRKFDPDMGGAGREANKQERFADATIFLPGWSLEAGSKSVETLGQSFADYAKGSAYAISTRAEKHSKEDMIFEEAEAIRQLVKEKGLSEIVISGYSQGGDKAIDLVNLLKEKDPNVNVKGLVLIDSVGLYEQGKGELARKFAKDTLLDTPQATIESTVSKKSFLKKGLRAGTEIIFNILREVGKSKADYPNRLFGEIANMAKFNERAEHVDVPVILVHGAEDPVSDPQKVAPVENLTEREVYLKKNLFKESPYVRMVVAEKAGHHGLPLFRPESVARSSLYMLKRFYRDKKEAK